MVNSKMKIKYHKLCVLFLYMLVSGCVPSKTISKHLFQITFGSCFKGDTITIVFNRKIIFYNIPVKSDFSLGADISKSLYFDGNFIHLKSSDENEVIKELEIKNNRFSLGIGDRLEISALKDSIVEGKSRLIDCENLDIDIKLGRFIFIDRCSRRGCFQIHQFKKNPVLK